MLLSIFVVRFESGTERRISPLSALANGMQQFPDTIASTLMAKCDAFGAPVMCRHNDMEADRGMVAHLGACMEHCTKTEILSRDHVMSLFLSVRIANMQDPNRKTTDAMQALQSMNFVHLIDAPLLALVMSMLLRGLTDRISETKKAALIFDNMCSMVNDAKDLTLYLDTICRQTMLLDSIPECRTVSSKAHGMLVKGQSHFAHLVPRVASYKVVGGRRSSGRVRPRVSVRCSCTLARTRLISRVSWTSQTASATLPCTLARSSSMATRFPTCLRSRPVSSTTTGTFVSRRSRSLAT
ncbi:hypothetical protein SDRG_05261 [Saprolegnia diclina VS20]|uniref:Uncharacterized protein n=1 Tax=Saprolegnia diclina (strain VS20) TaxID=1156394 RepID=T0S2Z8_SAPDV|nr:hypothetical protein SDRG_05261 [Saprolegnia diclina VS20]EQC37032.1 hypothetical protein SDRG_05261 [Saprolegnia diclina VS20]|eukprot:XP_008609194.1 hypothetical protein SDRG_05261 [Saprolegnia diclina VS20]